MKSAKYKVIQQGAEATIVLTNNIDPVNSFIHKYKKEEINYKDWIIKKREKKTYRIENIDIKLRKQRTKAEKRLLEKASQIINVPKPIERDSTHYNTVYEIVMPYIKGKKLSEHLDELPKKLAQETCKKIGQSIAKLHDSNIIHGDLTTSNIILDKNNNVWFIDFGLGFNSIREEDKAVDLHLIKQALEAKHFFNWENYWKFIKLGYKSSKNSSKVLEKLKKVESRGRYKEKY